MIERRLEIDVFALSCRSHIVRDVSTHLSLAPKCLMLGWSTVYTLGFWIQSFLDFRQNPTCRSVFFSLVSHWFASLCCFSWCGYQWFISCIFSLIVEMILLTPLAVHVDVGVVASPSPAWILNLWCVQYFLPCCWVVPSAELISWSWTWILVVLHSMQCHTDTCSPESANLACYSLRWFDCDRLSPLHMIV